MTALRRLLVLCCILFATAALAVTQNLAGFLTGPNNLPVTGARLTLVRPGGEKVRTIRSDAQGYFHFDGIDPGAYTLVVEADGYAPLERPGLELADATSTRLSLRLTPVRAGVGEVTELASEPAHESVLSTTLSNSPLTGLLSDASTTGLLEFAPGYHRDVALPMFTTPVYSGPSLHGTTTAENRYHLDGLDITDPTTGLPALRLPLEFVSGLELQVAGSPAARGLATGAHAELSSRFGGNEFHGDLSLYVTPYQSDRVTMDRSAGDVTLTRRDHSIIDAQTGFDLGGYIVPDRLWFFLGAAPRLELGETTRMLGFAENAATHLRWEVPFIARLTLNPTPDQTFQLSGYGAPGEQRGVLFEPTVTTTGMNGEPSTYLGTRHEQAYAGSVRYALRLPRIRTRADLEAGFLQLSDRVTPDELDLNLDGIPEGELAQTVHIGAYPVRGTLCDVGFECSPTGYRTGGVGAIHNVSTTRLEIRAQLSHRVRQLLGEHLITWGGELRMDRLNHTQRFTGGALYYEFPQDDGSRLAEQYLLSDRGSRIGYTDRDLSTTVIGGFLQDRWTPVRWATLSMGIRADYQTIQPPASREVALEPLLSPRMSATFNYRIGRPGHIAVALSRNASVLPLWLADAAFLTPSTRVEPAVSVPGPTPALSYAMAPSLRLPNQDELVAGFVQELGSALRLGVHGLYRRLNDAVEPLIYPDGMLVLANPGTAPGQLSNTLQLDACFRDEAPLSGDTLRYCYDTPQREYRAIEVRLDRGPRDSSGLWFHAAYTLSRLEGDYPGPVPQSLGSEPLAPRTVYNILNLSGDIANENRSGPLPSDRTHRIRAVSTAVFFFGLRLGAGIDARSGVPHDVLGPAPALDEGLVLLYPRGAAGRTPWVIDQQVSLGYEVRFKEARVLTLEATVFNPLQLDAAVRADDRYLFSVAGPASGEFEPSSAGTQLDCVDTTTGDSTACALNAGFGEALERQAPFSVRVMARYSF